LEQRGASSEACLWYVVVVVVVVVLVVVIAIVVVVVFVYLRRCDEIIAIVGAS
jgi:hypothetical protein